MTLFSSQIRTDPISFFSILYPILDLHWQPGSGTIVKHREYLRTVDQGINILLRWRHRFLYFALAQLRRSRVDAGVVGARRDGVQCSGGDAEATVMRGAAVRW